ncbi:MAG: DUF885 domain-containing protein [Candidatus Eremiobacteraeota bacterium]|nr:DUF885 domain-containing protein [Candidatus Eremiobacteraeota bacterium]
MRLAGRALGVLAVIAVAIGTMGGRASASDVYAAKLVNLAKRYQTDGFREYPTSATDAGIHIYDNRLEDFSAASQGQSYRKLRSFRNELAGLLPPVGASTHDRVDYLLLRSNIENDWWQRTYLKPLSRNPSVYEGECSNGIFSLLKKSFASDETRSRDAIARLRACRNVLAQGKANLTDVVREFAQIASEDIGSGDSLYASSLDALAEHAQPTTRARLKLEQTQTLQALHDYKQWIDDHLNTWHAGGFAVGKVQYNWYLRRVLLLPYDSGQVQAIGNAALKRDRALEAWENNRDKYEPKQASAPSFKSAAAYLRYYTDQRAHLIVFLNSHQIVDVPKYLGKFEVVPLPKALAATYPGGFMNPPGMFDTDPRGFYFIPYYNPNASGYFAHLSILPLLGHEGIPGHFMQFSIAYHNPDYIRHIQGDGVFAEGWAFYGEEMLMRSGLYENDPTARKSVIHLMRHRAARVGVDIGLATGEMSLPQAIRNFMKDGNLDRATAFGEATRFAMYPGQAIDYLVGKTQIETLLGLAQDRDGANFSLRRFHDRLLSYGTVPLSTIRWEWLNDPSWINRVEEPLAPVSF